MVLFFVGLGLSDHKDITLRGLETIRSCKRVFLEAYTSILTVSREELEKAYGCKLEIADRECVELQADKILGEAADADVAFCVAGDPFGATTHTDLLLRAHARGIVVKTVHNASIMNAVGVCGLQLYRFGQVQTVSIVFFTDTWRPQSFYDKVLANHRLGLHTLCLLDIKVKEPSLEGLARGRTIYEPARFMSIKTCLEQLLEIECERGEGVLPAGALCVGLARIGAPDQVIAAGTPVELMAQEFGAPLHSLIVCGQLDDMERAMLQLHAVGKSLQE